MSFLKKEWLINQNILGIIENVPWAQIYVDDVDNPTGVLVKKDDYMHYIYTENDAFIEDLCNNYLNEGFFGFSGVEGKLAEKLRSRYTLGWESPCTLYYLPEGKFDASLKANATERIRPEDAETVDKFYQYRDSGTLEIIKRDITNRPSSAVYVDGEIACWVLIHDDNSMGIMYTKEEHRRKGYAVDVTTDLIQQILDRGKLPYLQIVKGNGMSPGLADKCGFVPAGSADWFGIIAGVPKELIEINEQSRKGFLKNLPEPIRPHIFQKDKVYKGAFCFLHSLKHSSAEPEGFHLISAENDEQKRIWAEITRGELLEAAGDVDIEELLQFARNPSLRAYILYKEDRPIGASTTLLFNGEDRALHLLSLIPEYRSMEMKKLLAGETALSEKNKNEHFLTAQLEEKDAEAFEALGFKESHQIEL